jgi:transposase InsO family protein
MALRLLPRPTSAQRRQAAVIAFLIAERNLYRQHGPRAGRCCTDEDRRHVARAAQAVGWGRVHAYATLVTVKTLKHWWRTLIEHQPVGTHGGRRAADPETVALVLRISQEQSWGNDAWGRRRIAGELAAAGITVSPSTVRRILRRHGIPPAPRRGLADATPDLVATTATDDVLAIDFTTVQVGPEAAATPWHMLAGIHIPTRRVVILGITDHPDEAWMAQMARNLTMADVGPAAALGVTRIRMDRDSKFTVSFRSRLAAAGLTVERTDVRSPWQNGHIERWFRTLKTTLLRKALWLDPGALREAVAGFVQHYHDERPHQALGNRPPAGPPPSQTTPPTQIQRWDRVGGLISVYRSAAA